MEEDLKQILEINVALHGVDEVKGKTGEGMMIHFDGTVNCDEFHGRILPGGVDTQTQLYAPDSCRTMSARYILEGTDADGQQCHVFIENNALSNPKGDFKYTKPTIFTDSERLAYLETADLRGSVTPAPPHGVTIRIFQVL